MLRFPVFAVFFLLAAASWSAADAQEKPSRPQPSQCQAIAQSLPKATFASFSNQGPTLANDPVNGDVKITFLGHATLFIETPGGVSIATDFSGAYPPPYTPDVVTMNKAHPSHYTLTPDPAIKYVLHGWSDTPGEPAKIHLTVGDTLIRNVVTDIRSWGGGSSPTAIRSSSSRWRASASAIWDICISNLQTSNMPRSAASTS